MGTPSRMPINIYVYKKHYRKVVLTMKLRRNFCLDVPEKERMAIMKSG